MTAWDCTYCGSRNANGAVRCCGCGGTAAKGEALPEPAPPSQTVNVNVTVSQERPPPPTQAEASRKLLAASIMLPALLGGMAFLALPLALVAQFVCSLVGWEVSYMTAYIAVMIGGLVIGWASNETGVRF